MHTRPVWAEISRRNLVANYLELRRVAQARGMPGAKIDLLAVVKANAYGHGMRACAPLLVEAGAEWLGVTSVEEGVAAREVCPHAKILVMSGVWQGEADAVIQYGITPIVWEAFHLDLLEAAAQRHTLPPQSLSVHLELDTGMSRQGVPLGGQALDNLLLRFHPASALRLDGIATHFSAPEALDFDDTRKQSARFITAIEEIFTRGHRPGWVHAGNSANILHYGLLDSLDTAANRIEAKLMLRPGLSLYGYSPRFSGTGESATGEATLSPVLSWKTRVTSLRTIEAGEGAGYNSTFRAARPTRLALLPIGYADGLSRLLSNRGSVLIRGHRAPIAGRISMDQTILDVTDIPGVEIGDETILIGVQGDATITAYEIADLTGTIPYEVLCGIAARVPRVLVD